MLQSRYSEYRFEAGTAAVILPDDFRHEWLNDSKQLTERQRKRLRPVIEKEALAYAVSFVAPGKIDEINILKASILAMHRSLGQLAVAPEFIIVDGNRFQPYGEVPHQTIVKGDGKFLSIAAASILAKTYRDEYMEKIHKEFPVYAWNRNKGYPTVEHPETIRR